MDLKEIFLTWLQHCKHKFKAMYKFVYSLILSGFLISGLYAQRIIQNPSYEFRNTGRYRIGSIELSKESTKVQIINEYIPGWWVAFSQQSLYLENPENGEKYHALSADNLEWNKEITTPPSGVDTFHFTFPPLPKGLKTINCIDDIRGIYGINLAALNKSSRSLSKSFEGNWLATDGSNRWEYGFYEDFAIAGNRFWDYESVKKKDKSFILYLKSGEHKLQLRLTPQEDGNYRIGGQGGIQSLYHRATDETETTADIPSRREVFFQLNGKAHVQGYIRGYDPRAGFRTGIIYGQNVVSREEFPTVVEVKPDGRFSVDIPVDYPTLNDISMNKLRLQFYVQPGDTLTMFIDWEDCLLTDRYRDRSFKDFRSLRYMGPHSKINTDWAKFAAHIPNEGNIQFFQLMKELAPVEFKDRALDIQARKLRQLENLQQKYHFAPQSAQMMRTWVMNDMGSALLDFLSIRESYKDDTTNAALQAPVPDSYYDFLRRMPLDDPYMITPYGSWVFINRFEYAEPFKAAYQRTNEESTQSWAVQNRAFWKMQDSIYTHFFHLSPSFTYDVIKVRGFKGSIVKDRAQSDSLLANLLVHLKHPYLRQKAGDILEADCPARPIASKPLPEGKAADIFRKIISPYQGKVIFVDFWATSCGPCRSQIKSMTPVREKYEGKDLIFLFITDEKSSPLKTYQEFMADVKGEKYRLTEEEYNYLRELFQINGIPHNRLINKKGEVVNTNYYGGTMEDVFDILLKE